ASRRRSARPAAGPASRGRDGLRGVVRVAGAGWEVRAQRAADLGDGRGHAVAHATRAELPLQHVAHGVPEAVAYPRVDPVVADDREVAVVDREVEEHARPMAGPGHADGVEP